MGSGLDDGINFFNSARYFQAHEAWEDLWREERGGLRTFYQGLVQAAVGMHHLTHRNLAGARAQLSKSLSKLDRYPPTVADLDVETFRRDLRKVLDQLAVGGTTDIRIQRFRDS